jgi:hypothetical protein
MNAENQYSPITPHPDAQNFAIAMNLPFLGSPPRNVSPLTVAHENYTFDSLMIHAWLSQLLEESIGLYTSRKQPKFFGLQSGQAQRGFLRIFGNPEDDELHRLIQNMYRFTSCDDPMAAILLRALDALSAEHDSSEDFSGQRAPDFSEYSLRPNDAMRWMRESMERWFEWIDAYVHLQTHAQWHLAPERFHPDPHRREASWREAKHHRMQQFRAAMSSSWQNNRWDTSQFYRELPLWQVLPQVLLTEPQRPWPHPELDEAIIILWPLVKRHHWSYGDLLNVLGDLLDCTNNYVCEAERNLGIYCHNHLHLRKSGQGRSARTERPEGYVVAVRLVPPVAPPPILTFPSARCFPESETDEPLL